MSVYVDDMRMIAKVGRLEARWSHMMADTRFELHAFAARLGLRPEWFQDPMVNGKMLVTDATCRAAQNWHYDVTDSVRARAIRLGAIAVSTRELSKIIDERYEREFPAQAAQLRARVAIVTGSDIKP